MNRFVVEEEYGFTIDDIGKPVKSSVYSGLFRLVGTFLPLIPYFFGIPVITSIVLSVFIGMLMLIITGFILALSTNLSIKKKITELIVNGLVLTAIVFLLGNLTSQLLHLSSKFVLITMRARLINDLRLITKAVGSIKLYF